MKPCLYAHLPFLSRNDNFLLKSLAVHLVIEKQENTTTAENGKETWSGFLALDSNNTFWQENVCFSLFLRSTGMRLTVSEVKDECLWNNWILGFKGIKLQHFIVCLRMYLRSVILYYYANWCPVFFVSNDIVFEKRSCKLHGAATSENCMNL